MIKLINQQKLTFEKFIYLDKKSIKEYFAYYEYKYIVYYIYENILLLKKWLHFIRYNNISICLLIIFIGITYRNAI